MRLCALEPRFAARPVRPATSGSGPSGPGATGRAVPSVRAMISAHMATAVSSGVRAPMSRPIGAITRFMASALTPARSR